MARRRTEGGTSTLDRIEGRVLADVLEKPDVGAGTLVGLSGGGALVLPLTATRVRARILGGFWFAELDQEFLNATESILDCDYIFPHPGDASLDGFTVRWGSKTIESRIRGREEGEKEFAVAREAGHRAGLVTEERPNISTLRLANVAAGERVETRTRWIGRLDPRGDEWEWRWPLVVGERYIPGQTWLPPEEDRLGKGGGTEIVPDADSILPPRLAPGTRWEHDLSIEVLLAAGSAAGAIQGVQHPIRIVPDASGVRVVLTAVNLPPDRDFILRWTRPAGPSLAAFAETTPEGEFLAVFFDAPRERRAGAARAPIDLAILVDCSGSMQGPKLDAARRGVRRLLRALREGDRFQLIAFESTTHPFRRGWTTFDESGLREADAFAKRIESMGGTELFQAMQSATSAPSDPRRAAHLVILTDGQVGDEARCLELGKRLASGWRIHTMGIDTAVNDAFLKRLASEAGGRSVFTTPDERIEDVIAEAGTWFAAPIGEALRIDARPASSVYLLAESRVCRPAEDRLWPGDRVARVFGPLPGPSPDKVRAEVTIEGERSVFDASVARIPERVGLAKLQVIEAFRESPEGAKARDRAAWQAVAIRREVLCELTAALAVDPDAPIDRTGKDVTPLRHPVPAPYEWEMFEGGAPMLQARCCLLAASAPAIAYEAAFEDLASAADPLADLALAQGHDGLWPGGADTTPLEVTVLALAAFERAGHGPSGADPYAAQIEKAWEAVLARSGEWDRLDPLALRLLARLISAWAPNETGRLSRVAAVHAGLRTRWGDASPIGSLAEGGAAGDLARALLTLLGV